MDAYRSDDDGESVVVRHLGFNYDSDAPTSDDDDGEDYLEVDAEWDLEDLACYTNTALVDTMSTTHHNHSNQTATSVTATTSSCSSHNHNCSGGSCCPQQTQQPECPHLNTTKCNDGLICIDCGLQLKETLVENEQRHYDYTTPNRYHVRRVVGRSLYADLEKHNFPAPVVELANVYYTQMINGNIYRAKTRLGIVFACTFNAFKVLNEPRNPDDLARLFVLDKKGVSGGLKKFSSFFKNRVPQKHINALDLAPKLLADLGIDDPAAFYDLTLIYEHINKCSMLYRSSNPQSVAAGLIKYYLDLTKREVPKATFSAVVGLTDITYTKIADETDKILNYDNVEVFVPVKRQARARRAKAAAAVNVK